MNQATILMIGSLAALLLGTASGLDAARIHGGDRRIALAQSVALIFGAALTTFLAWTVGRGV